MERCQTFSWSPNPQKRTSQEEYKLLLTQLPTEWQINVIQEGTKRARGKHLVRMTGLPNMQPRVLQDLLEDAISAEIDKVTTTAAGYQISCADSATQTKIMGLAGNVLDEHVVRCSRVEPTLTGEQLADFVTERLQGQQKFQALK